MLPTLSWRWRQVLLHENARNAVVLVLANKQDVQATPLLASHWALRRGLSPTLAVANKVSMSVNYQLAGL